MLRFVAAIPIIFTALSAQHSENRTKRENSRGMVNQKASEKTMLLTRQIAYGFNVIYVVLS